MKLHVITAGTHLDSKQFVQSANTAEKREDEREREKIKWDLPGGVNGRADGFKGPVCSVKGIFRHEMGY